MKLGLQNLANFGLFILLTLVLVGFQTALWLQVLGHFPPPHFPTAILAYWALYRTLKDGLIMTYLLAIALIPFTSLPLGPLLIIQVVLFLLVYLFRQRIFWAGPTYYMMIAAGITLLHPFVHLAVSWASEANPIHEFEFFEWSLRPLLTALVAMPIYYLFRWVDRITNKELPKEAMGSAYL